MTPEQHQRIGDLYHRALELPAERREAFLAEACGDDEALGGEVWSLLQAHDQAGDFIEAPAMEIAAAALAAAGHAIPFQSMGPYEVRSLLGRGGMGEVYRAHDRRLGRDVALKILPDRFALDAQHLARFEREARLLAALNHPNIGALYSIEESDGRPALILELVEGIPLVDRLATGPLPLSETLAIARQIADALDAAHEQDIVHRDLKPANVVVRTDGTVKVLDFGIAKALAPSHSDNAAHPAATPQTQPHMVLGTAAYMSPEHARGLPVDARTDIWAFGCVLYEMLTGRRAFAGDTTSDVIASILERAPDWDALPPETPPLVRRVLRRCLEKDPKRRVRSIADVRSDLEEPFLEATIAAPAVPQRRWHRVAVLVAATAVVTAAVMGAWAWLLRPSDAPPGPVRMTTLLPPGISVMRGPGLGSSVALSPDGRTLVIAGTGKDGQRLYVRPLDRLDAAPLAGTERGSSPFFSWDGAWVGFFADGRLKRVPADGGAPVDIAPINGPLAGVSWASDDRIVFAYGGAGELHSVDALGGNAERLTAIESGYYPDVLPDGRTLLFESGGWVYAFDSATGRRTRLLQGNAPRYTTGRVILSRGRTLMAAAVDLSRHEVTGPVVPLVEGVAWDVSPGGGNRHYAISRSGTLAYVPAANTHDLVLVQPDGPERLLVNGDRQIQNPQFSPDGRMVAVARSRRDGEPADLWIHDLDAGTATRLTFDGGRAPVWMPDGRTIAYSHLGERRGIYAKRADGSSEEKQLLALDAFHWLVGWTPDRRALVYGVMEGTPGSIMELDGDRTRRIIGPGDFWGGRLSADGRWLTYYSRASGNFEVYVTPFPEGGTRWHIADGTDPTWGPDGSEVYYRSGVRLMAARIDRTSAFRVLSHRVVIEPFLPPLYDDYHVHPDGRTLVIVRPTGSTQAREVTVVVDWLTEVGRLVGTP